MSDTANAPVLPEILVLTPEPVGGALEPAAGFQPPVEVDYVDPEVRARRWILWIFFLLPSLLGLFYFGFFAADRYTSVAKFVVRSASGDAGNISSLVASQGLSRAADETYIVGEYLTSRDAIERLADTAGLRGMLSRPEVDAVNRFPNFMVPDNKERLYQHYKRFIHVDIDGSSGVGTLEVTAFRPEDSQKLTQTLLKEAEELVNRLNIRAHTDYIAFEEQILKQAETRLSAAEAKLDKFRNSELVVDPSKQSDAALNLVMQLNLELSQAEAQLSETRAVSPNSPQISNMREKVEALRTEIERQRAKIVGNNGSYASKLSAFERLSLERDLAAKAMAASFSELARARQSIQRREIYLQTIVTPNLADQPTEPKRLLSILIVCALSFAAYRIARTAHQLVMEHRS